MKQHADIQPPAPSPSACRAESDGRPVERRHSAAGKRHVAERKVTVFRGQGDTFARKATVLPCKATVSGGFPPHGVTGVNPPAGVTRPPVPEQRPVNLPFTPGALHWPVQSKDG